MSGMSCNTCAVRHRALCELMSDEQRYRFSAISHRRSVAAGEIVIDEHESGDFCAIVISGIAKLVQSLADGRVQIVGLLFPSDVLGRPFGATSCRVEAATYLTLCVFPKRQFEQLITQCPNIEHGLCEHVLDGLDAAREWMLVLGRKTAAERIASFVLMASQRVEDAGRVASPVPPTAWIELPLRRGDIADFLGIRVETVSRQLTRLQRQRIIELKPGGRMVAIRDRTALLRAAGT